VDLATELTGLITAQRAYEANSKVITTSDDLLQTLVNLKQG
jgi:flagellar hook protein FlgE